MLILEHQMLRNILFNLDIVSIVLPYSRPESPAQLEVRREGGWVDKECEVGLLKVGNVVEQLQSLRAAPLPTQQGRLVHAVYVTQLRGVATTKP